MSSNIFVRYDLERRLLACGYHDDLPVKLGQVTWMDKPAYTTLILDVPPEIDPRQAADLFFQTRIEPPCFWVPFSALGPGREIIGQALPLAEAAPRAGMTRGGLKGAVVRGDLPSFKDPPPQPGKGGPREHHVNILDLERFLAGPRRPPGRPATPKPSPAPAKKRGRPKGAKDTKPRKLWHMPDRD